MRGKVANVDYSDFSSRITPAYAGKSAECSLDCTHILGSPLRMRGKVFCPTYYCCFHGITPAYAGKSKTGTLLYITLEDHPCVCGEKQDRNVAIYNLRGSPLRMRGKDGSDCYELTGCRITPAYAGKSYLRPDSHAHDKDHPCVCGEKVQLCTVKDQQLGSPLRMRGKEL